MRLFRILSTGLLLCLLMIGGYSMASETDVSSTLATADEVLAYAKLTAEELPGVDVDAFIADEQLTTQLLHQLDEEVVRDALLEQIVPITDSCEYLLQPADGTVVEWKDIDVNQIKRIAVVSTNDALMPSLMIDFERETGYFADGYFFHDIDSAAKVTNLTGDMRADILKAVENAGIESWKNSYVDSEETLAAQDDFYLERVANWVISFEFPQGVIQYSVFGVDTGVPESFFDLGVYLYNMFW